MESLCEVSANGLGSGRWALILVVCYMPWT